MMAEQRGRRRAQQRKEDEQREEEDKQDVPTSDTSFEMEEEEVTEDRIAYRYHDPLGNDHWVVRYPKTVGKKSRKRYTMARRCSRCKKHTCCYCMQCNIPLCYCISNEGIGNGPNDERDCFREHIRENARRSARLESECTVSELVS